MKRLLTKALICMFCCAVGLGMLAGCGNDPQGETPGPGEGGTPQVTATKLEASGGKTEFKWGEEFSYEGLTVVATFSDGTQKTLGEGEFKVSSALYNAYEVGSYNIQVTYGNVKTRYSVHVVPRDEIKFLMIGNSYSDDAIEYVYQIAGALGIKMTLGNLFIGNCSLQTHYNNITSSARSYEFRTCSEQTGGVWKNQPSTSSVDAIKSQDWDYISLQQNSTESGHPNTFGILDQLIPEIRKYNTTAELVWHMPWADAEDSTYSGHVMEVYGDMMSMYNAYVSAVQQGILTRSEFKKVITTGTAIQNARTSLIGAKNGPLNRDGHHLTYGLGRYIASLTVVAELTGADLTKLTWAPSGVTEQYRLIAIESAMNAVKTPYAVTQSEFPPSD